MFKKLIACISLMASMQVMAGGPIDGIYSCGVSVAGSNSQSYVTINGHADGNSIFAVAAVSASTNFYGYGIGTATANKFTGQTMFGQPFDFNVNTATGVLTGTIGMYMYGSIYNGSVNCMKIW